MTHFQAYTMEGTQSKRHFLNIASYENEELFNQMRKNIVLTIKNKHIYY